MGKKFPLAVFATVIIQTIGFIIWLARFDERTTIKMEDHERRISRGEILDDRYATTNSELCQRLARIEERSSVSLNILQDMKETLKEHNDNRGQRKP